MKEIILTQGMVALVDDEDYEFLNQWKWHARKNGTEPHYAVRMDYHFKPKRMIKMHRVVLNVTDPKIIIDHTDHNTLDNRKSNLRICTRAQNTLNRLSWRKGSSKYLGVSYSTKGKKWIAQIEKDGKNNYLGSYNDEVEAAKAYNRVASIIKGEFAYLNKV